MIPNDPSFGQLWAFKNTGQVVNGMKGSSGSDISMPAAWDLSTGSRNVVVAVIDTGVYYTHPDLVQNMWSNPGESCSAGIDTDQNGFVADCRGWDFVDNDNDPMDFNGHGTHVAGIIGAAGNNLTGTVGVNWAVQIMPLRVLDSNGEGTVADVIAAVDYATKMGARVINASFGGEDPSDLEKEAIQAFISGGRRLRGCRGQCRKQQRRGPLLPCFLPCGRHRLGCCNRRKRRPCELEQLRVQLGPRCSTRCQHPVPDYIPPGTTSYYDGFTTLDWTTGGTHDTWNLESGGLSDSPGQNYLPGTNSWAASPLISLHGVTGCRLSYNLSANTVQNEDFFYTETSSDGVSWTTKTPGPVRPEGRRR